MKRTVLLLLMVSLFHGSLVGQEGRNRSLLHRADTLQKVYQFNEAIVIHKEILATTSDSLTTILSTLALAECENGINMLQFATTPYVNGRVTIPSTSFFLSLPDQVEWYHLPDSLSSDLPPFSTQNYALFSPDKNSLYFSAKNSEGDWDLYSSHRIDGEIWSHPAPLPGQINSEGNELFPIISQDGNKLYFASDGHFGMGGYDLYESEWDPDLQEWLLPHNLGFPYSSTHNDLMILHSSCGNYTFIVSDRAEPKDFPELAEALELTDEPPLALYRLEFEANPLKRAISTVAEAVTIATLKPREGIQSRSNGEQERVTEPETQEYTKLLREVREIERRVTSISKEIASKRELYGKAENSEERGKLESQILESELQVLSLRDTLERCNREIQRHEMDFLSKGRLIPREVEQPKESEGEREVVEPLIAIEGRLLPLEGISFMPKIKLFDYTLFVDSVSVMAPEQEFPEGLIYRVQLIALNNKVQEMSTFKGLRPIYEARNTAGRYIYSAGQFTIYTEAQRGLAEVKRAGFPRAIISAFLNGKSVTLRSAQELEKKQEAMQNYQVRVEGYPAGMPQTVLDFIKSKTDKDIARQSVDNREIYFIGPFSTKAKAEEVEALFNSVGAQKVFVEAL